MNTRRRPQDISITPKDIYNVRPAYAVNAVDRLERLKQENKTWEAIELIVQLWVKSRPQEYKSYLIDISDTKATMKDKKFGTTKTKGSNLRRILDIPEWVFYVIRMLYTPQELPMNKAFYRAWGRKFPKMLVVEKL